MTWIDFPQLSLADAWRYCARFEARLPSQFAELSTWVARTDGPLEQLDGSWDSLLPFWHWYLRFLHAGAPGVPASVLPLNLLSADGEDEIGTRASYVGSVANAYICAVVATLSDDAVWKPLQAGPDWDGTAQMMHHEPFLFVAGQPVLTRLLPVGTAYRALEPGGLNLDLEPSDRLQSVLIQELPKKSTRRLRQPGVPGFLPAPGTLTPAQAWEPFILLDPTGLEGPGERELRPIPTAAQGAPPVPAALAGGFELALLRLPSSLRQSPLAHQSSWHDGRKDLEQLLAQDEGLQQLPSFSAVTVDRYLRRLGFEASDSVRAWTTDEVSYLYEGVEAAMQINLETRLGRTRIVEIEWINTPPEQHADSATARWLIYKLQLLAAKADAVLVDLGG